MERRGGEPSSHGLATTAASPHSGIDNPTMTNATITRPEWSTVIDPVLQKELEQHVLVTTWDKLLGMVDTVYNWGRRSALWPLGFGLACCAIEMICTASSRFDIARFGAEVFRGSPRQADLMIVSGTVTKTMMPMIARLYDQMPEPKYVIAMGACATGGGPFKEGYNVVSGVDKYIPVDVYIPGCPADAAGPLEWPDHAPEEDRRRADRDPGWINRTGNSPWYGNEVERDIPVPVLGPDLIDLRTVEIAAETTAMGLLDAARGRAHQAGQDPRAAARASPRVKPRPRPRRPPAQGPEQDRPDPRQGARRGAAAPTAAAAEAPAAEAKPAASRQGRQEDQAGRGPADPGLARRRPSSTSWPSGSMPSSAPAPSRSSRPVCWSRPTSWSTVALFLRDKNPIKYDYLASLQSVHYEDCIEVNYQLDSTTNPGTLIELRVRTAEAEGQGEVPSLYHVYRGADFQEREVYDMMGVRFTGPPRADAHPDVGGLRLSPAPQGLPRALLRGADEGFRQPGRRGARPAFPRRGGQPLRHEHEGPQGLQGLGQPLQQRRSQGQGRCCRAAWRSSELDTDQFVVSMGPQHPSTHGVFRINLRVDGETIVGLKPVMGYMHRNHEKIGERNTFLMNFPFTDRLDYLTSMGNNFGYALAVEQLMGDDAKPPERAEYIRVIMAELTRIASHMWSIGFLLNDLGAFFTPALYAIEERELILDLFEWAAGSRMMCNYFRFGGVAFDLPPGLDRALPGDRQRPHRQEDRRARPLPLGERDRARPRQGGRRLDPRAGDQLLDGRPGAAGLGRRLRHPPGRARTASTTGSTSTSSPAATATSTTDIMCGCKRCARASGS